MRVDEPAVAVLVTELAFVVCQVSVTLCPSLIEFELAENTSVGLCGGGVVVDFWPELVEQEQSPQRAIGIIPNAVRQKLILFIHGLEQQSFASNVRDLRCQPVCG